MKTIFVILILISSITFDLFAQNRFYDPIPEDFPAIQNEFEEKYHRRSDAFGLLRRIKSSMIYPDYPYVSYKADIPFCEGHFIYCNDGGTDLYNVSASKFFFSDAFPYKFESKIYYGISRYPQEPFIAHVQLGFPTRIEIENEPDYITAYLIGDDLQIEQKIESIGQNEPTGIIFRTNFRITISQLKQIKEILFIYNEKEYRMDVDPEAIRIFVEQDIPAVDDPNLNGT